MKPKIYIGINALSTVHARPYMNHNCNMYMMGKSDKYEVVFHTAPRTSIDRMRNECARNSLIQECDYLFFIDDDMVIADWTLDSLIDADKDIVMAHTFIRGYPFHAMSFKDISEQKDNSRLEYFDEVLDLVTPENKGVIDCAAVGFATVLIKTSLFKKIDPPYFITSATGTEDVYFCIRCKEEIPEGVSIAVDTRVPTGHLLDPEPVSVYNVENLRKYYEAQYNFTRDTTPRKDRSENYLKAIESV